MDRDGLMKNDRIADEKRASRVAAGEMWPTPENGQCRMNACYSGVNRNTCSLASSPELDRKHSLNSSVRASRTHTVPKTLGISHFFDTGKLFIEGTPTQLYLTFSVSVRR
jgi:hypothetical protein